MICPHCKTESMWKNGINKRGKQRYICKICGRETVNPLGEKVTNLSDIIYPNKKESKATLEQIFEHCKSGKQLDEDNDNSQQFATIDMSKTKKPIIICCSADWHLGSTACDYVTFQQHLDLILSTPNVYLGVVGDVADNFIHFKNLHAIFQQVLKPELQVVMIKKIFSRLQKKKKIKFVTCDNHDIGFDERSMGYSIYNEIYGDGDCPYIRDKGLITFKLGKQTYYIAVAHKHKGKSQYYSILGELKTLINTYPIADIVIGAHLHHPAIMIDSRYVEMADAGLKQSNWVTIVQTGTYKDGNDHYAKSSWSRGIMAIPSLVLFPNEHKVLPFMQLEDAIKYVGGF